MTHMSLNYALPRTRRERRGYNWCASCAESLDLVIRAS
jgi:hypothetical protein